MIAPVAVFHQGIRAPAPPPGELAALAFRGVVTRFGIPGLDPARLGELAERYCPGTSLSISPPDSPSAFAEDFGNLLELLRENRRDDSGETAWLARAVAGACAGGNHLWEDMGLPDRDSLSLLIRRYFPILYHKNAANMRWKKFFYKQLCDRAGARLCKAPNCGVCSDASACFGPE